MGLQTATIRFAVVNTETITYFQEITEGSWDTGTTVNYAKRIATHKDEVGGNAWLTQQELPWHLWTAELSGITPKVNDYILDVDGNRWDIFTVDYQRLKARFRVTTKKSQ